MKRASAYLRTNGWFLSAVSRTTVGIGMDTPPRIKVEANASDATLGEAVLQALSGSREGVPHPDPKTADRSFDEMLDLAGVKSWAAFAKNALNVGTETDGEWLVIEPWKNEGAKRGFTQIANRNVRVRADASPSEIGAALKSAIELCE
ncbi:MAG: contact-dependent growth inhibition system immunity protein [Pirellulales bacterium]